MNFLSSKITTIQKNCQKIIQDFKNHIRYIEQFTQKYQLGNVFKEEVKEITNDFIIYINENYLKSCPIKPQERRNFEEASFENKVWRDFMKQQLVKYKNLGGQKDPKRLQHKLSRNSDKEVTLKLMDLQGIINEMEELTRGYEDIQNINIDFKQSMVKEQSNDDEIPDIYNSLLTNALNERSMLQTLMKEINVRLNKYRIVINEKPKTKTKYVIDINEYLRERGIGSISEFLDRQKDFFDNQIETPCLGNDGEIYDLKSMNSYFEKNTQGKYKNFLYEYNDKNELVPSFPKISNNIPLSSFKIMYQKDKEPSYEKKDIVSTKDLKNFYNAWYSEFAHKTEMKKLLNQQKFQNTFKRNMKEFDESITFSNFITDTNMDRSNLKEETKENINSFMKKLYRFYDLLYKFLSNKYGIEFIPNFRIIDTTFSEKKEPSLLLKQKYLDRIVELYNKLKKEYQDEEKSLVLPE